MKGRVLLVAMLIGPAAVSSASGADFDRGKLLYNARCVGCHDKSVHNREARKALTIEGIRAQVRRWDAFTGGAWREDEVNDVTAYLNELIYRYPCPPAVCPEKKATLKLRLDGCDPLEGPQEGRSPSRGVAFNGNQGPRPREGHWVGAALLLNM